MTDSPLTASRLWKQMTSERRLQVARAFWLDEQGADEQIQAALLISQRKKFRPKTVISLDTERKARHLASLSSLPDPLAARALIAYHLAEQRPMMSAFLDEVGVAHDNGLIKDNEAKPESGRVAAAAAALAGQFPADHVSLYLNTLLLQDPETWRALEGVPQLAATA